MSAPAGLEDQLDAIRVHAASPASATRAARAALARGSGSPGTASAARASSAQAQIAAMRRAPSKKAPLKNASTTGSSRRPAWTAVSAARRMEGQRTRASPGPRPVRRPRADRRSRRTQRIPRSSRIRRRPTQPAHPTLPMPSAMPALKSVATEPTTPALPTIAALPATPELLTRSLRSPRPRRCPYDRGAAGDSGAADHLQSAAPPRPRSPPPPRRRPPCATPLAPAARLAPLRLPAARTARRGHAGRLASRPREVAPARHLHPARAGRAVLRRRLRAAPGPEVCRHEGRPLRRAGPFLRDVRRAWTTDRPSATSSPASTAATRGRWRRGSRSATLSACRPGSCTGCGSGRCWRWRAWGIVRLLDALLDAPARRRATWPPALLLRAQPVRTVYADRTSVTLLAYAALPWLLLCVHRGLREPRGWRWPALVRARAASAGGGVNVA